MATTPTPAPSSGKVSWLSKVGHFIGKVLGFVATEAKPIADTATQLISTLYPELALAAQAGDALVSKIALQAAAVEAVAAKAGTATGTGAQKFEQVLQEMGPAIDQWVANAFPGAAQVSAANKAGLVQAVVSIVNDITPTAATPSA